MDLGKDICCRRRILRKARGPRGHPTDNRILFSRDLSSLSECVLGAIIATKAIDRFVGQEIFVALWAGGRNIQPAQVSIMVDQIT